MSERWRALVVVVATGVLFAVVLPTIASSSNIAGVLGLQSSSVGSCSSNVGTFSSTVGGKSSTVGGRSSTVGGKSSTVGGQSSTVGSCSSSGSCPTVGGMSASVGGRSSTVGGKSTTVGSCSSTGGQCPPVGGMSSTVGEKSIPGCGTSPPPPPPAPTFGGEAIGLSARVSFTNIFLLNVPPVSDTGPVSGTASINVGPFCQTQGYFILTFNALCGSLQITRTSALASAQVTSLTIGVPGLPAITIGLIKSSSLTTCAGSAGLTTISYLAVGGRTIIAVPTAVPPNETVTIGNIQLVLNQQIPIFGTTHGLTVNAVDLSITGGLTSLLQGDVVLASSTSDVKGC